MRYVWVAARRRNPGRQKNGGMMRKALIVEDAARRAGPYSHAVVANGVVYVSGQGPADPITHVVPDSFAEQVRQTLRNLQIILKGSGADLPNVVKISAYLSDLSR